MYHATTLDMERLANPQVSEEWWARFDDCDSAVARYMHTMPPVQVARNVEELAYLVLVHTTAYCSNVQLHNSLADSEITVGKQGDPRGVQPDGSLGGLSHTRCTEACRATALAATLIADIDMSYMLLFTGLAWACVAAVLIKEVPRLRESGHFEQALEKGKQLAVIEGCMERLVAIYPVLSLQWIWVRRVEHEPLDETDPKEQSQEGSKFEQAKQLLEEYTKKIVAVQKDDSIPVRSNKKKGLRSKKEVREEIMAEAAGEFKRISQESKLTCGKWLFFATPDHIDALFARLTHDLVNGALSKTPAFCVKVATTPSTIEPNHRYLICLYLPDLYDKDAATEVLRTVCQSVGVRANSAKADLYTLIGLDSKHPSGMKSTIWNPADLIPETELKALLDAYWEEAKKKAAKTPETDDVSDAASNKPKQKGTKLKRKVEDSDDDDNVFDEVDDSAKGNDSALINANKSPASKHKTTSGSKPASTPANDSATESESDDAGPAKPAPSPIKKKPAATAKPKDDPQAGESSSDEGPKRPKKVRRF
ncbi:hypothetical protein FRC07_010859 [Ceratobasidium sp. 392]|nr:hypothetical protein FRC07_010859 [Ceratobasidium sp. 392]